MKIVYISNHARVPSRDANSVHLMKMCASYSLLGTQLSLLVSTNHDIHFSDPKEVFDHYGVEPLFQIKRTLIPSNRIGSFLSMNLVTPFRIAIARPQFVHSRNLNSAWLAAKYLQIPTLYELHDSPARNKRALKRFQELTKLSHCKGIIVITKALQEHVQQYVKGSVPVLCEPDGVDSKFLDVNVHKDEARKMMNINPGARKVAVYTGHLYEGRGIELIVQLAERTKDYLFVLVGGKESDIERWKKHTREIENILFAGFRPPSEIPVYQQAADVLLMPYADKISTAGGGNTASYASPLKMFEYMASRRPVLSSTLPVLSEVLVHGYNSYMCDYNDANEWLNALQELKDNPSMGERLADVAYQNVCEHTWQKRAERIVSFMNTVL